MRLSTSVSIASLEFSIQHSGHTESQDHSIESQSACRTCQRDARGDQTVESRLDVAPNLPKALDKFELLLDNAEHSAFTDRALPGDKQKRNANHHKAILALSTAFWDTYLKEDAQSKAWLIGDKVKAVLEENDRWQHQPGCIGQSANRHVDIGVY